MAENSAGYGTNSYPAVRMCEVCEQSTASVACKADAAALCVTCDRVIHSANPLARRHDRIPLVPFCNPTGSVVKFTAGNGIDPVSGYGNTKLNSSEANEDEIVRNVTRSVDLLSAADRLFNLGFRTPAGVRSESQFHDSVNDGVDPIESTVPTEISSTVQIAKQKSTENRYQIDVNRYVNNTYNKSNSQSHSHSVSSSSIDASNSLMLPVNGGGMCCNLKAKRLSAKDREARVLRYREKRKKRRFEKNIRYASRKAYAEMRPRIKGRFAKGTVLDGDRWLFTAESNSYGDGEEYGVVPSF